MSELVPKLIQRTVKPEKLYLDPNNPRLITRDDDTYNESEAIDRNTSTHNKICDRGGKDSYRIKELENSIKQNGWWPIDFIFVKKLDEEGRYLVLEGNRRVTAIQNLINDENTEKGLLEKLKEIEVMEIIHDCSAEQLQKKITYLLGVRHHGSLKKWTPFAQANNIYLRYLELAGMSHDNFEFKGNIASDVGDALSIDKKNVERRLKVYRAMRQLGEMDEIKDSEGGIEDRYYSVCEEVLTTNSKELQKYISQDNNDFTLDKSSLGSFNNLCCFDKPGRTGAPISNPQEWRKLANILKDEDDKKRSDMLEDVELKKIKPSIVWAERAAELQTLQWDKWLNKVNATLKRVTFGDDITSDSAKSTIVKLSKLIEVLDNK